MRDIQKLNQLLGKFKILTLNYFSKLSSMMLANSVDTQYGFTGSEKELFNNIFNDCRNVRPQLRNHKSFSGFENVDHTDKAINDNIEAENALNMAVDNFMK